MRIIHSLDYFQPQLGYQDTFLAQTQIDDGHDVSVITSDRYRPFENYEQTVAPLLGPRLRSPGVYIEEGITVYRLPVLFEHDLRCWVKGLEKTILKLQPDIVQVHGVSNFFALRIAWLKARLPQNASYRLIIDDHMVPTAHMPLSRCLFYYAFRMACKSLLLSQADALVAVSADTKRFMEINYQFPSERIEIVPLGADTRRFQFCGKVRQELRQRIGVTEDEVLFIYAGKIVPAKGPDLLIKAALALLAQGEPIRVLLVGNGPDEYVKEIKSWTAQQGFADRFFWQTFVPNESLPDYYSAADVGVWPKESSLTMIEAQACRLPIIVSDFPVAAERISCNNGLVFRQGDVADLAAKMERLIADKALRQAMGERGFDLVKRTLDYRVLSRCFLELATVSNRHS